MKQRSIVASMLLILVATSNPSIAGRRQASTIRFLSLSNLTRCWPRWSITDGTCFIRTRKNAIAGDVKSIKNNGDNTFDMARESI
jgi:hypothetical protein